MEQRNNTRVAIRTSICFFIIAMTFAIFSSCTTTKEFTRPVYEEKRVPVYETVYRVRYTELSSPIFLDRKGQPYRATIPLAILGFIDAHNSTTLYESLMVSFRTEMANRTGLSNKFQIYEWKNLIDFANLKSYECLNKTTQSQLYQLNIYYSICCRVFSMYPQKIEVLIYRNSDGSLLLKKNLQDTDNSTAIKDAVELLANNRAAEYYSTQVVDHYDVEKVKVREEKYTQTVKNKEATGWLVGTLIVAALVGIIYLSVPH